MAHRREPQQVVLSETDRDQLRDLVVQRGERDVSDLLGVDRRVIARALAALPLRRATREVLAIRLAAMRKTNVEHIGGDRV